MEKIILLLCFLLVLLAGCSEEPAGETNVDGSPVYYDKKELDESPFSDVLPSYQADYFIGELPTVIQPLSIVDITLQNNVCVYQGNVYQKVILPSRLSAYDCFWQLDCSYLHILGKTDNQEIIYAIGEPAVVLIVVDSENTPQWYVNDTGDLLDPCTYSVDDFDVEIIYGLSVRPNSISEIWEYHTGKEYDQVRYFIMDHLDFQRYFLRCKDRPWLVYELSCPYTYDGLLYIYNVPNDGMLLMNE